MPIRLDGLKFLFSKWLPKALTFVNMPVLLIAGGVVCGALYIGWFVLPKPVNFSYAAATCKHTLTLLPDVQRLNDSSKFKAEYRGGVSAGKLKLASTEVCFTPVSAPQKGAVQLAMAPYGGWLFQTHYKVTVNEAPRLLDTATHPQPLSKPLELKLSQPDVVFHYYLEANGKIQACVMKSVQLVCGVDKLGLKQGAAYALKLQRNFGSKPAGEASALQLAILPATKVLGASIKPGELIYDKPKNADITLDKPLAAATARLELMDGDKAAPVDAQVKMDGVHVLLSWAQDLPRERTFRVVLTVATASDGSTLDGDYTFNFRTSGGPKVVGVSGGGGGVAADSRVVVTFDQPLAKDTNIASFASISGGGAAISRLGSSQVVFALRDIPRCGAFTLNIAKGIVSDGGIVSDAGWSQASRVNCRLTKTIGYSVKGRPIQAYFYGTGPMTVLFTGGIHGNEPSGMYIMQDWAAYLDTNAYRLPAGKQVVVVPNLNPDGIAANQRYNASNVNLDRNFPTSDWISDIQAAGGQVVPHGGGTSPLSEPETKAIADLTSSLQLRAEFSFHSSGALVGANKIADSVAIGSQYAKAVGYGTVFYNPEETFGYSLTGEYETWMGEKANTPAILIELPTSNGRFFSRHQNVLWNMAAL